MGILLGIVFYILAIIFGVITMMNGWGLEIHSLGWIIGGNCGVIFLAACASAAFQISK